MKVRTCGVVLCGLGFAGSLVAQQMDQAANEYSRKNTWTVFADYSNTSSHILLGGARQRELAELGGGYSRRLMRFWGSDFGYQVEVRPVLFESDPLTIAHSTVVIEYPPPEGPATIFQTTVNAYVGKCIPLSGTINYPPAGGFPAETLSYAATCGRQWTFGQAFSPVGFRYSMRTRHPVQPFLIGTLGYMYTSRPVPVAQAEAFNFVFDFGAGVEVYHSERQKRSVSLECRYHHFSNRDTAEENPGTDNLVFKASYNFGR